MGSLTNFGTLNMPASSQTLMQFMEGEFFEEICYIKNHPIAGYFTLIDDPWGFRPTVDLFVEASI